MTSTDVVGLSQIAKRCNVKTTTVRQWRSRFGDFPAPGYLSDARGSGSAPFWLWGDVEAWLDEHTNLGDRR